MAESSANSKSYLKQVPQRKASPPRAKQPSPPPARQPSPPPARQPPPPPARQPSSPPARQPSPPPARQPSPPPAMSGSPKPPLEPAGAFTPEQGLVARAVYDYQAAEENEVTFDPDEYITNIEKVDSGWWIGITPRGQKGMFPANYVELVNEPGGDGSGAAPGGAETASEDRIECARAKYDYQADGEKELSFKPGDVITNIKRIDDGWWTGVGPDGKEGLFPANYVTPI